MSQSQPAQSQEPEEKEAQEPQVKARAQALSTSMMRRQFDPRTSQPQSAVIRALRSASTGESEEKVRIREQISTLREEILALTEELDGWDKDTDSRLITYRDENGIPHMEMMTKEQAKALVQRFDNLITELEAELEAPGAQGGQGA